jgi:hypothetical protein
MSTGPTQPLWLPRLILDENADLTTTVTFSNDPVPAGQQLEVDGVDVVVSGTEPTQVSCAMSTAHGSQFFYDSQSLGEGLGVNFSWRGALPLQGFDPTFTVTLTVISGATSPLASCVAWGKLWLLTDFG